MLDLGSSFLASVERDPDALAIVDSDVRLSYRAWYAKISSLVAAFDDLDLKPGDHLVTVLQIVGKLPPFTGRANSPASSSRR